MDNAKNALRVAALIQEEARELGLSSFLSLRSGEQANPIRLFDSVVTEVTLRNVARQLFVEGHYALAVEEAYKCLNNFVKSRSGLGADGASLMKTVFSAKNPTLRLNALKTQSQQDQQIGYMDIFAGCMTGIRNPRAHEHRYIDDPQVALELLSLANHLLRMASKAKRARRKSSPSSPP